jgi:hypothetical protein
MDSSRKTGTIVLLLMALLGLLFFAGLEMSKRQRLAHPAEPSQENVSPPH